MGSANTWVVLKNSSRPTLRDQGQQCQDQDQDRKKRSQAVSRPRPRSRGLQDWILLNNCLSAVERRVAKSSVSLSQKPDRLLLLRNACSFCRSVAFIVREYVFYVFFENPKKRDFLRFFWSVMSKNVKIVESVVQVFTFSTLKLLTNTFTVKQLHTSYTCHVIHTTLGLY